MADTVFGKILRGELPATVLHTDDRCIAILDIAPKAPFHGLVIPRKALVSLAEAVAEDEALLGHLLLVAKRIAAEAGHGGAFRLVMNTGAGAGQTISHLHVHVLAGGPLPW
jgi:histidine triad (HIT) family protein